MLLSDIDTWNVGALQSIAHELGGELKTIEDVASDLELISRLPGWESPAADAARGKITETTGKVLDEAAVIGAVQQLASETAAAVAKLHTELDSIRADVAAQGGYLTLSDNGDVTINAPPDMRDELRPIADDIESRAKALIHQAEGVGKGDQSVSTIAWLGYDPPDTTDISVVEAGFEHGSDVHLSRFRARRLSANGR